MNRSLPRFLAGACALLASLAPARAQAPGVDAADTSFMIAATALVLMMTLPGLALFYAGMVRRKNILATMAQSFAATAIVSLLWFALAYSLDFTGDGAVLGGLSRAFLAGIGLDTVSPLAKTIPEMLFMAYQMTFAVIAVALVGGAVADRLKFSAFAVVSVFWLFLFGFNGGSALAVGSRAVFAIVATHFSACAGAVVWSAIEWKHRGKPSVLGVISGAVAGLGAITPASGYVLRWQGALIGAIAGGVCYFASTSVKQRFGYDDTLNVFGLHGVGGVLGTLLAGVFATASVSAGGGDPGVSGLWQGNAHQFALQIVGVAVTLVWCGIGAWISLKLTSALVGLRVSVDEEREGLDVSQRGEAMGA